MGVLTYLKTFAHKQQASHTKDHLIPRKVKFDWAKTPLEWIPGQPFASHFINQINMLLPAGEFWFCRMYNKALPLVSDDKLRDDVQMFIRQEAMHARAHGSAIKEYLQAHQIDTRYNTEVMDFVFERVFADQPFGMQMPKILERRWLLLRLGIIAAVEHFTCVLGNYALDNHVWDDLGADPVLLDLLRWHGAEEVEHRCVAFDLYSHLGGDYLSRYYLTVALVPVLLYLWVDGAARIMQQDPRFAGKRPSFFRPWIWMEWHRVSFTGNLPHVGWLIYKLIPYLTPWYNPQHEGSTMRALAYLNNSPAARLAQASGSFSGNALDKVLSPA